MEIIVKYKNRKLYSKKASAFVNGDYLIDLIRTNMAFKVVEYNTGVEVTGRVLTGILSSKAVLDASMAKVLLGGSYVN
jgi:polyhydroxyalkanoate synthesis regulator protein